MKKSKSLFEALTALKAATQTLFKKMPVLFLRLWGLTPLRKMRVISNEEG